MPQEPLIWIDFTTSLDWTRPAVGIVRVEQECGRWLLKKYGDRVRICVFDQSFGAFLELEHKEAWEILRRDWNSASPPIVSSASAPSLPNPNVPPPDRPSLAKRVERRLRRLALAALKCVPTAHQPSVRRRLLAIRRTLAYGYREWIEARVDPAAAGATTLSRTAQTRPIEPSMSSRPLAKFQAGDCYLTMGLDWDHNKQDFLYREKKKTGVKVFNFAYDIIPVKFPHYYPSGKFDLFSTYFATMAWTADHIFCISKCTARDLHGFFEDVGSPSPPMSVVRLGDVLPTIPSRAPSPEVTTLLGAPYLLSVSTIEIRKNHETLYRALLRLIESGFDVPTLVLVGMTGWRVDDFLYSLRHDPRVANKIVILDHVTDSDLATLYDNCLFTLYPSLYEGWGLPVAESLAHGKFCLASDAASIAEIAGDIVDYVDPWNVPQWADKIRLYCANPEALRRREESVASRFRVTSWEATANQIAAAITSTWPSPAPERRDVVVTSAK